MEVWQLFRFVKSVIHQILQSLDSFFLIITFGAYLDCGSFGRRKHHHTHNALAVNASDRYVPRSRHWHILMRAQQILRQPEHEGPVC